MPAHMAPQRRSSSYCSPAVRKIQSERDLERSKKLAVTANSGVIAKKRSPPRRSAQVPPPPGSASITQARRIPTSAASEQIRAGTTVSVRTPVGKLRGGKRLVLWLSAVVVSAAEEGYLTVVYKGNFPPEDPFQTVRVARQETKKMAAMEIVKA
ncbi:hypothetical protein E2562_038031 [Oryza meyeriana var. granulata]|uniref:Uncharacterized protein n=1 Tax=Oryza meyeriana var. granulata TaxID=110450 RepID=A0A6G1ED13_9ORYZ|nr:hypothetical protein E2562_038031 [Oryza meyeriana var. granulata]